MTEPRTQAELDAERSVIGAVLAAGSLDVAAGHRTLERAIATVLDPAHFYGASSGNLYARMLVLHERGLPLDPVSIAYELERDGAEPDVIGRLRQLAYEVTAISPVARWAEIVAKAGRTRTAA